jgi:ornithine cyclodeaminase/alanine dehydrogenase-like protein (mu-crystallin family)
VSATDTGVLILSARDVRTSLTMNDCIEIIDRTMRTVSRGGAQLPLRTVLKLPFDGNVFASMPGFIDEPRALGAKLIAVYPGNPSRGRSSHMGVIVLFDPETGAPAAFIDAAEVTAIRTAAASAVATRALARPDATQLAILGTGEQAREHLRAMAAVRRLRQVRVWGRSAERAEALVAEGNRLGLAIEAAVSARQAVADADLICTTTGSHDPILFGDWIAPGAHVNLVGASVATMREADDAVVTRSRFFVDYRASALAQAGEFLHAKQAGLIDDTHIVGEIGEVLNGSVAGRRTASEITVYKSLGSAAQDLAVAQHLADRARRSQEARRIRL